VYRVRFRSRLPSVPKILRYDNMSDIFLADNNIKRNAFITRIPLSISKLIHFCSNCPTGDESPSQRVFENSFSVFHADGYQWIFAADGHNNLLMRIGGYNERTPTDFVAKKWDLPDGCYTFVGKPDKDFAVIKENEYSEEAWRKTQLAYDILSSDHGTEKIASLSWRRRTFDLETDRPISLNMEHMPPNLGGPWIAHITKFGHASGPGVGNCITWTMKAGLFSDKPIGEEIEVSIVQMLTTRFHIEPDWKSIPTIVPRTKKSSTPDRKINTMYEV